ncbi:Trp biosynthesis-associated membrane protein [Nocardioides sp. AX2bis]|uniref:Trp biosynthesis-associated membrane protein n=1 Tax=Nocardioides sp. AX2bis TaxID=2653157 RepID=UPI0012EEE5FC|nr:Trp biosynthesis-associated membrane protein [Nocardioides sp. AX2bis]VXB70827.1 conserved membrane hypothetical protein [Nocardioides sp. AX2bis]
MTRTGAGGGRGPRRTFGPVILLGLAGAGLAAFGGSRAWAAADDAAPPQAVDALGSSAVAAGSGEVPLAGALALVALACWGVLLVTRGRVRRLLALLAAAAAAGVVATVVVGAQGVRQDVRDAVAVLGQGEPSVGFTVSLWLTGLGAVAALVAAVLAVRWAPSWPEMGRRYDAPGAAPAAPEPGSEASNLELWKSLDQGRDPTT